MAVISELIRSESDGTISFGDYSLGEKKKLEDFNHEGDSFKVKTYAQITRLEKNGLFVYESVPGTSVEHLSIKADGVCFTVEGNEDAQITLELEPDSSYDVTVAGNDAGQMTTNMSGKLSLSVELDPGNAIEVVVKKI